MNNQEFFIIVIIIVLVIIKMYWKDTDNFGPPTCTFKKTKCDDKPFTPPRECNPNDICPSDCKIKNAGLKNICTNKDIIYLNKDESINKHRIKDKLVFPKSTAGCYIKDKGDYVECNLNVADKPYKQ